MFGEDGCFPFFLSNDAVHRSRRAYRKRPDKRRPGSRSGHSLFRWPERKRSPRLPAAPLFRDTLEIKFTRNSAYFVPGPRARNRNERASCEQLARTLNYLPSAQRLLPARLVKSGTAMRECMRSLLAVESRFSKRLSGNKIERSLFPSSSSR